MTPQLNSPGEYVLIRTKDELERLERQYNVWQSNIGYLLHPAITQRGKLRVADVGTGTGIWLRDLSKILPGTCQLDGFDLSDAMFFKKTPRPTNVSFIQHNLLKPFPAQFTAQYDVVNVRAMVVALSSDEWEPALRNLMSLLRPGGYIQWLDCSAKDFVAKGATEGRVPINAERWTELLRNTANALGKTPNVNALYRIFRENGLKDCSERVYPLDNPADRDELNKAVLDGIHNFMIAALNGRTFEWAKSADQVMAMKEAAQQDLHNLNCWFSYNVYVVVGRKA
ncbi:hypothetical protein N7481_004618 [Penicillium waksmanii]|uniref:uncharacterized protein n=1 Tax=Penicillium waksmanii TaxID=69791 RepID=UPI0025477D04|nr:uncharacterized protein N7481_004618 [Penicillium waksmanii]KAJ5989408.1 hypothetical protein N7481_004618 [Penicillium waksmanii]